MKAALDRVAHSLPEGSLPTLGGSYRQGEEEEGVPRGRGFRTACGLQNEYPYNPLWYVEESYIHSCSLYHTYKYYSVYWYPSTMVARNMNTEK